MSILELENQIIEFKKDIIELVKNMPDNQNIERIGNNCFIILKSKLSKNLSPSYYDYLTQYNAIIQQIEALPIEKIKPMLMKIIEKGSIKTSRDVVYFHPDVQKCVENLVGKK